MKRLLFQTALFILISFILLGVFFYNDATGPALRRLKIIKTDIVDERIPESLNQLQILYFSDLHAFYREDPEFMTRIFDEIAQLKPDVILFGGDLIDASVPSLSETQNQTLIDQWSKLKAPLGCFAVLGEDDLSHLDFITSFYASNSCEILTNQSTLIRRDSDEAIRLVGLANPVDSSVYPNDGLFTLSMAYDPSLISSLSSLQTTWLLAAKTHGGQVTLPLMGSTYSKATGPYIHGQGLVNGIHLSISNGLETLETQARFMDDPSLYLYTLRNK